LIAPLSFFLCGVKSKINKKQKKPQLTAIKGNIFNDFGEHQKHSFKGSNEHQKHSIHSPQEFVSNAMIESYTPPHISSKIKFTLNFSDFIKPLTRTPCNKLSKTHQSRYWKKQDRAKHLTLQFKNKMTYSTNHLQN